MMEIEGTKSSIGLLKGSSQLRSSPAKLLYGFKPPLLFWNNAVLHEPPLDRRIWENVAELFFTSPVVFQYGSTTEMLEGKVYKVGWKFLPAYRRDLTRSVGGYHPGPCTTPSVIFCGSAIQAMYFSHRANLISPRICFLVKWKIMNGIQRLWNYVLIHVLAQDLVERACSMRYSHW